jgi:HlyD family secretion protein
VSRISGGKVPSRTELDSARSSTANAIAAVRSAQEQVNVAKAQLGTSMTNLSKARIVSPVNGVVLSRDIEPGQTVAASFNAPVLFTIAEDLQQMEVDVSVDEADVGQVQQGQRASFTVDAFPGRTFPATVRRVNVGSNSSSTSSTTTTATVVAYTAVLSVSNADETLRPGMTATADITTRQLSNVLMVPNAALRFKPTDGAQQGGGITSKLVMRPRGSAANKASVAFGSGSSQTVYVLGADGQPQPVEVVVGDSDGTRTVILSGDIKAGTRVITGQLAAGQSAPPEAAEKQGKAG